MVGATGFEPATSWSQTRRSTRLSYTPNTSGDGGIPIVSMFRSCANLCLRRYGNAFLLGLNSFSSNMDTISRENNSMLPVGGIIVGVIALALGLYSAVSVSKVKTQLAQHQEKIDKIDDIASQASAASAKADSVKTTVDSVVKQTQDAFNGVGNTLGTLQAQVAKLEEGTKKPAKVAKGAKGEAGESVVAGPGEYVVKAGDTGHKIATSNGCTVSELIAVNAGVDWKHLKVGQKIKLPEKKT